MFSVRTATTILYDAPLYIWIYSGRKVINNKHMMRLKSKDHAPSQYVECYFAQRLI